MLEGLWLPRISLPQDPGQMVFLGLLFVENRKTRQTQAETQLSLWGLIPQERIESSDVSTWMVHGVKASSTAALIMDLLVRHDWAWLLRLRHCNPLHPQRPVSQCSNLLTIAVLRPPAGAGTQGTHPAVCVLPRRYRAALCLLLSWALYTGNLISPFYVPKNSDLGKNTSGSSGW